VETASEREQVSEFLSADEVRELTGYARRHMQRAALDRMGIKYARRPDGMPVVSRRHVERVLGANLGSQREPELHL
jgi:hypothetical protein